MSEAKHVFIIGITGCIGGSVFAALKAAYPSFTYTALVRNPAHFPAVAAAGAEPVLGSYTSPEDHATITRLAREADLVINCADSDNVGFAQAVIDGLKRRKAEGRGEGLFVHTSGAAVFMDGSLEGKHVEGGKVWNDGNVDDIKAITADRIHGPVDVAILEASAQGHLKAYIVCPVAVHGTGSGPVGRTSVLARLITGLFVQSKRAVSIGEGTNLFKFVHVLDLATLYVLVISHALAANPTPKLSSPYERYFIAAAAEVHAWKPVAQRFAASLHRRGLLPTDEVANISAEEVGPMAGFFAGNALTKEERGAELGWNPQGKTFEETLEDDLDMLYPPSK